MVRGKKKLTCGWFQISFYLFSFSTGAVSAHNIVLVKKKPMRYQGVVCATKVGLNDCVHASSCLIKRSLYSVHTRFSSFSHSTDENIIRRCVFVESDYVLLRAIKDVFSSIGCIRIY